MMLKDIKRTLFYQYTCIYELRDLCLCALPYPSDGSDGMALSHERTVYIDVAMEKCLYLVQTPSVRIDQVSTHPSSLINRASLQSLIAVSHCSLSSIECHQSINHRSMGIARPIYASTYKKRRLAYARLAIYGCLPSPAAAVGDDGPVALGARLVRDDPRVERELDGVLVEDAHRVE